MSREKAVGGHDAESGWLRINVARFFGNVCSFIGGASAIEYHTDVVQTHSFNVMARIAGDLDAALLVDPRGNDIGNSDVPDDAVCRVRTAVAVAKGDVNRIVEDVHHGDVIDGNVFENATVDFLERQSVAMAEGAIGNSDVAKAAIGLGAEFNS